MGLNDTISAERIHIAFFGCTNAGKSSLVNAITGQALSLVSEQAGTTTDPVQKAMELLPLGPVLIIDTAGLDDTSALGALRMQKTMQVLETVDIAVLVVDAQRGMQDADRALCQTFAEKKLPYLLVYTKSDLLSAPLPDGDEHTVYVSAKTMDGIHECKERLAHLLHIESQQKYLIADKIHAGDTVILVIPIDASAPKGRLILPQQQTIRELLDAGAMPICCRDTELPDALSALAKPPALVITDSQAFGRVAKCIPDSIPMTSFSILFARYKGELPVLMEGAKRLSMLHDGDRILISEGCTHHRQCGDIGTVKLPAWIQAYANAKLSFTFTSGGEFPDDVSEYALVVHCGGCMLSPKEMQRRMAIAGRCGIPMLNYGIAIAQMNGILPRSLALFRTKMATSAKRN